MLPHLSALLLRGLPLPIHSPTLPDRWFCHSDYGHNILPFDCQKAVDDNWPSGRTPVHYYSSDPSPSNGIRLPRGDQYGTCTVSIETAGPGYPAPNFSIAPNHLRALAGFIIEACGNQAAGIGGFVTYGFKSAEDYIAGSANTIDEDIRNFSTGIIADGNFLTISISSSDNFGFQPGDTEPEIAGCLSSHAANISQEYLEQEQLGKAEHFLNEARFLRDRAVEMSRGGYVSWWFDVNGEGTSSETPTETDMDDTASSPPAQTPDGVFKMDAGNMTYQCDTDLGSPQAMDCEKLVWSGLKTPDSIEALKPNTPNIYTSGTCALGISSPIATTISWAHLLAAFETLNNLCVQNPISSIKGGRAYYGSQSVSSWFNGKRDSVAGVNGSEALPVGVNATVWRHDAGNSATLKCEWELAMEGKKVSECARD